MRNILCGIVTVILFLLNLFLIPILVILIGLLASLFKNTRFFPIFNATIQCFTTAWMSINNAITLIPTHGCWEITSTDAIDKNHSYLMVCNHQSWVDILVLSKVFNSKIPLIKFFLKKELLWGLPIAGLACKFAGYPFMERATPAQMKKNPNLRHRDLEITQEACRRFKLMPSTIMNFVEGTRFTGEKREKQAAPYQHLLKPQAGGLAIVLSEMKNELAGVIDVSIAYDLKSFSFWDFACGRLKKIRVHYALLPLTPDLIGNFMEDREYRKHLQGWLNAVWHKKDRWMA